MVTEPPWLPRLPDADASEGGPGALLENRSPSLYLLLIPVCLSACLPLLPSLSPCLSLSLPPHPRPQSPSLASIRLRGGPRRRGFCVKGGHSPVEVTI